jgi:hypothetical protein
MSIDQKFQRFLQTYQHKSHSELQREQFVLFVLNNKQNGFFVEFGAMGGVRVSNAHMLEKIYGWTGNLIESNHRHRDPLKKNRKGIIDFRCVGERTENRVQFLTASVSEYSGMVGHIYWESRSQSRVIKVETLGLNDLLIQNQTSSEIDYISVDTDDGESSVMKSFDFSQHRVNLWTIEHNYVESTRRAILDIMTHNGYQCIHSDRSAYNDWYIPC